MIRSRMRPRYLLKTAWRSGLGLKFGGRVSVGGVSEVEGEEEEEGGGRRRTATTGLWSDVVYEGIEVYKALVMVDTVGVSSESVYVVYMILSVHAGTRFKSYLSTCPSSYLYVH